MATLTYRSRQKMDGRINLRNIKTYKNVFMECIFKYALDPCMLYLDKETMMSFNLLTHEKLHDTFRHNTLVF